MINEKKHLFMRMMPDFKHEDVRGKLLQLVSSGYSQVNYIETQEGAIRGWHYHRINKEAFFIICGHLKVDLWKISKESFGVVGGSHEEVTLKSGDMFFIEPYVLHVFTYKSNTSLISFYSVGVEKEDGSMDIFKPEVLPSI